MMRFRLQTLVLILVLAGCVGAPPAPTLLPGERPTVTPLPPTPAWRQPAEVISVDNVQRLSLLGRLDAPPPPSTVFAHAVSPDGTRLAALNNDLLVTWELVTGEIVFSQSRQGANGVFYSPDKDELYTLYPDGTIAIHDPNDGTIKATLRGHETYGGMYAYSAPYGLLALGGTDGTVKVWDMFARVARATLTDDLATLPDSLAFTPDGTQIAVANPVGLIRLWNWETRENVQTFEPQPTRYSRMAFSADRVYLAAAAGPVVVVWDVQTGNVLHFFEVGEGGANAILHFYQDTHLLFTGGLAPDIRLWNTDAGAVLALLQETGGDQAALALAPDGALALTTGYQERAILWNLAGLEQGSLARGSFEPNNPNLFNAAWTDDGFLLLLLDSRGPIEVWGVAP